MAFYSLCWPVFCPQIGGTVNPVGDVTVKVSVQAPPAASVVNAVATVVKHSKSSLRKHTSHVHFVTV